MLKTIFFNIIIFGLLGALFLGAMVFNNMYANSVGIDLTERKIYSLSKGSQKIAADTKAPITLQLFFSESNSTGMTALRDYKARVQSLLQEYVKLGKGNIHLEIIDPEPFSEAQDSAAAFGLTAASTGSFQNTIYFGLAGTNNLGDTMVIGFFDPSKEAFLEYDISTLLYSLNEPEIAKLTIVTDLEIAGGENPLNGKTTAAFVLYQQLEKMFDITLISSSTKSLPSNTDVLLLWHSQNINEALLFSIDQFLMRQGRALALVDAHYESDLMAQMGSVGVNSSFLPLLASYGIKFDNENVVLDALTGLEVRNPAGGLIRHLGFLGLTREQINPNDITTTDLDSINGASFGTLSLGSNSLLSQTVLLSSSAANDLMPAQRYMATRNPAVFAEKFTKGDEAFILAARYSGSAVSHFADAQAPDGENIIRRTNSLNLVVIADADIAADRFWVQSSNFFGQMVSTPFANNGDFIINTLENLSGSDGLIGIRSRATFDRPFTRVQVIRLIAEENFRAQEKRLQKQLEQTEKALAQLQIPDNNVALSAEQEATINGFTEQRMAIRKSLREVQFQLQRDIEALGDILKLINIVLAPVVLVLLLLLIAKICRKRAPKTSF
ncbi:hypothetical protein GPUN_0267 [Glaciecola punicea ACAM 611]|jgi:ABC-type uncharacterized transport system involved in gliding motility auxiliary subunit|uniref:Uncharacterized protein n=1 Tax=Glaciecola punicea ACAM 611 TaxID=1121923 RepID=H5T7Z3_9ALTE|nr:GldG family protein [Glaciecola punicea]GAB54420.1 hypothetical protein GPUN_0267 [Glaciecola punicea ACAM 611]